MSQAVWDAEYVNNWHQGSAIVINNPRVADRTQIIGNEIEHAAQGIDIHADHVIVANNILKQFLRGNEGRPTACATSSSQAINSSKTTSGASG